MDDEKMRPVVISLAGVNALTRLGNRKNTWPVKTRTTVPRKFSFSTSGGGEPRETG